MNAADKLKERIQALKIGEELFQCYDASLPKVEELKKMLDKDNTSTKRFRIWPVINGTMVKREA